MSRYQYWLLLILESSSCVSEPEIFVSKAFRCPRRPLEGEWVDHTLWPEVAKLFGHPNGVTCLAASPHLWILFSICC
jgi:hypothetical protein